MSDLLRLAYLYRRCREAGARRVSAAMFALLAEWVLEICEGRG